MDNVSRISRTVRRVPEIDGSIKLEVGCGHSRHPDRVDGWIGVDIVDYGQECVWDIEQGLPFPDNSASHIYCSHVLEHIGDLIGVMNEFHRVLRSRGELYVVVPHKDHEKALEPTHIRLMDKNTFRSFNSRSWERDYGMKPWDVIENIVNDRKDIHVKMTPKKLDSKKEVV